MRRVSRGQGVRFCSDSGGEHTLSRYFLLLFGLCLPVWVVGPIFDIQLLQVLKLFQAGLAMPMIAALLLTCRERGRAGLAALLRRTYDVGNIKLSFGFINYSRFRFGHR